MSSDSDSNSAEPYNNSSELILSSSPDEELLQLIDLCPFLASEKSTYDDAAVLNLLTYHPVAANKRHSYRCGIGTATSKAYPLALVVALGGSLDVVTRMVNACPMALNEKLSGRRNVLHYAIAEGVNISIIQYLTSCNLQLVKEVDSFHAIPLHLACTYFPTSSCDVVRHLLHLYPQGAGCLDNKSQTPLHRACRSRASLDKIQCLIEAYPEAMSKIQSSIEKNALQGLMYLAMHAASPSTSRSARIVLDKFYMNKKSPDVELMFHRTYGPLLWRGITSASSIVRVRSASVLADTFPTDKYCLQEIRAHFDDYGEE